MLVFVGAPRPDPAPPAPPTSPTEWPDGWPDEESTQWLCEDPWGTDGAGSASSSDDEWGEAVCGECLAVFDTERELDHHRAHFHS